MYQKAITETLLKLREHPEQGYSILEELIESAKEAGFQEAQESVGDWLEPAEFDEPD